MHLLINLVDDIEMIGVMSTRNIFFMEIFLKVLKGFVIQHSQLEGFMGEGKIKEIHSPYASFYNVLMG